jgi:hypothetical protein
LGTESAPSFDNGFDAFYNATGKGAGTYVLRNNGLWREVW